MTPADLALFNQAVATAQSGNKQAAYQQLISLIRINNNHFEPDILLWLAYTTPDLAEASRALDEVAKIDPSYPGLGEARGNITRELSSRQQIVPPAYYPPPAPPPVYYQPPPPYYQPPVQPMLIYPQIINVQPNLVGMAATFVCPYCRVVMIPRYERRISGAGWIVFTVLLLTTLIFAPVGLFIKEDQRFCTNCGRKI